jgi:cytochrome c553
MRYRSARPFTSIFVFSVTVGFGLYSGTGIAATPPPVVKAKCSTCHGIDGISGEPATPRLAGMNPAYIVKQIKNFAEGRRRNEDMTPLAGELGEDGMQAVAAWYGSQLPIPGKPADTKLAAAGKQLFEEGNGDPDVQPCVACHQADAGGNARFPRLAGQSAIYLQNQLGEFKAGRRATDPQMVSIAQKLSAQEIRALAAYLAGL